METQKTGSKGARGRQIVLPLGVALRIAYENIRMRLGRSLLTTSGIVLGVAFLTSIMASNVMMRGMRQWGAAREGGAVDSRAVEEFAPSPTLPRSTGGGGKREVERLQELLNKNGVPVTAEEMANDRIQTRWLLGLALLVAFIGILNSTLMSVTERFREIGTMKCLGALDGFILRLVFLENLFQGLAGTTIGILLGAGLAMVAQTVSYGAFAWKNVPVGELSESMGYCFVVGLALTLGGAICPAWQAARMQPIAAMRVEP
jgi:putative ABC transport system permease protein